MFKKKLVSLALAVTMVASLCACGGNTVSVSTDAADETAAVETNDGAEEVAEVKEPDLSENVARHAVRRPLRISVLLHSLRWFL